MSWLLKNRVRAKVDAVTNPQTIITDEDFPLYLEITDKIRSMEYTPKQVILAIRKRLEDRNPRVQFYTLKLLDFCAKNSGPRFTDEALGKPIVDDLVFLVRHTENPDVREEALHFIALWGSSETGNQDPSYIKCVYSQLKSEDLKFPEITASEIKSTKYDIDQAPSWIYSSTCGLCHVMFTVVVRQHHCRACGKAFCGECSKKIIDVPKYGYFKPVRVCDLCYDDLTSHKTRNDVNISADSTEIPSEDQQLRRAMEISAKEYDEMLIKSPRGGSEPPLHYLPPGNPPVVSDPIVLGKEKHIANISYLGESPDVPNGLSPAQIESITMLEELIFQLRQSSQNTPGGMIEVEGARELLEKMNTTRLDLVKSISACNSEAGTVQIELDEMEYLEKLWNTLVERELRNVSGSCLDDSLRHKLGISYPESTDPLHKQYTAEPHTSNVVSKNTSSDNVARSDESSVPESRSNLKQDRPHPVISNSALDDYNVPRNSEILDSIFGVVPRLDDIPPQKSTPNISSNIELIHEDCKDAEFSNGSSDPGSTADLKFLSDVHT